MTFLKKLWPKDKKKKIDLLIFLKNHKLIKWLFLLAAIIGATVTIIKVPTNIYNYLHGKFNVNQVEFNKIEKVKNGASLSYIKSIFDEPSFKKKCEKKDEDNSPFEECLLLNDVTYKYTFERDKYYLQVLTDSNDIVIAYTIFLKEPSFNPEIKLFMGRFAGSKILNLGVTTFSEFDNIEDNDGYTTSIDKPVPGNNFGGFLKLINSDDYAVDYFLILESASWASWSRLQNNFYCDYYLLNTYEFKDGDLIDLDNSKIEKNINRFKKTCPIQAITVIDKHYIGEEYWNLGQKEEIDFLNKQLQFFSID